MPTRPPGSGSCCFSSSCSAATLRAFLTPNDPLDQDIFSKLPGPSAHILGTDEFRPRYLVAASLRRADFPDHRARLDRDRDARGLRDRHPRRMVRRAVRHFVMQLMDMLLAFPALILGLIVVAMLGPSMTNIIIAIALTSIPPFARIARAPTISSRSANTSRPAARSATRTPRILVRPHLAQYRGRNPGHGLVVARQRDPHGSVACLHRPRHQAADADLGRHDPRGLREYSRQCSGSRWFRVAPSCFSFLRSIFSAMGCVTPSTRNSRTRLEP